jgi:hypothetical protein
MAKRILSYLIFTVLMVGIIAGSLVVVVLLYLPMVALKAVIQTATGKAKPRLAESKVSHETT